MVTYPQEARAVVRDAEYGKGRRISHLASICSRMLAQEFIEEGMPHDGTILEIGRSGL